MGVKVEWKSALEDSGAQFAITPGIQMMLQLSLDSLESQVKVRSDLQEVDSGRLVYDEIVSRNAGVSRSLQFCSQAASMHTLRACIHMIWVIFQ